MNSVSSTYSLEDEEWETLDMVAHEPKATNDSPRPREFTSTSQNKGNITTLAAQPPPSDDRIKERLVDDSLQLFWVRLLWHLAQELWRLDVTIRIALALILLGIVVQASALILWYVSQAKWFLMGALGLLPFLYLYPRILPETVDATLQYVISPEKMARLLTNVEVSTLRVISLALLLLPTLLEMRALTFLACTLHHNLPVAGQLIVPLSIAALMIYLRRYQHCWARECLQKGELTLYVLALLAALRDPSRLVFLAGPFLLATGVLVVVGHQNQDWFSNALRQALRDTLRDVVVNLHDTAREDEMLRLAMMRWLVDYWSSSSPTTYTPTSSTSGGVSATSEGPVSSKPPCRSHVTDLDWGSMMPMLTATTQQMSQEHALSHSTGNTRSSSASKRGESTASHHPSSSRSSQASSVHCGPFDDLQSLLTSINLDERAAPAVKSYKLAVQAFPPARSPALVMSIARRCPALLTVILQVAFSLLDGCMIGVLLSPVIVFELFRLREWMEACLAHVALSSPLGTAPHEFDAEVLEKLESMTILLMDDVYNPVEPPVLLVVWRNACASVAAIEKALMVARCVQTTAAAVDFASQVKSLATLGFGIAEHGWVHGLFVIAREATLIHSSPESSPCEARYTQAALGAIRNSQTMHRNVTALSEEGLGHLVHPVGTVLSVLAGRGWLWDRPANDDLRIPASTVVIEEIPDDIVERHLLEDTPAISGTTPQLSLLTARADAMLTPEEDAPISTNENLLNEKDEDPIASRLTPAARSIPEQLAVVDPDGAEFEDLYHVNEETEDKKETHGKHHFMAEEHHDDRNGLLVGLAVVGAAVGGLALAAMGQQRNRRNCE